MSAIIISNAVASKIKKLNRKFEKFANDGWMCENGGYEGKNCLNLFNNQTDEFVKVNFNGDILLTVLSHTTVSDAKQMADIQSKIAKLSNGQ